MILDIPGPTSSIIDYFSHTIATIDVWADGHIVSLVTLVLMPEDLTDRPFISIINDYSTGNIYYQLTLITSPKHEISIRSASLPLLRSYLDGILANTSITIEDTKSKFPELFL